MNDEPYNPNYDGYVEPEVDEFGFGEDDYMDITTSILGRELTSADHPLYLRVIDEVRESIKKTIKYHGGIISL